MATTLSKLGTEVSARLIYQGYVVTMCNLHVLFDTDFPLVPDMLAIERFRALITLEGKGGRGNESEPCTKSTFKRGHSTF